MRPIGEYRNKFSGRIFLLGNGPTLLGNELSNLGKDEVMSINRAWRHVPGCLFHLASGDLTGIRKAPQNILFYGQESMYPAPRLSNLGSNVILIRGKGPGHIFEKQPPIDVPRNFDLRYGWPVTAAGLLAVYCAWWLGFRVIYLLGFDGYGTHYADFNWGEHRPDHEKLVPEFRNGITALQLLDQELEIYNCNPENSYDNLPIASYKDLW